MQTLPSRIDDAARRCRSRRWDAAAVGDWTTYHRLSRSQTALARAWEAHTGACWQCWQSLGRGFRPQHNHD